MKVILTNESVSYHCDEPGEIVALQNFDWGNKQEVKQVDGVFIHSGSILRLYPELKRVTEAIRAEDFLVNVY